VRHWQLAIHAPDFVFFHEVGGKIVASILDPDGHHLDDCANLRRCA
jgi:hypothetical protein